MPGLIAFREEPGKALQIKTARIQIGDIKQEKKVSADDISIVFEVELPEGDTELTGTFVLEDGKKMGSFYAEVEKL